MRGYDFYVAGSMQVGAARGALRPQLTTRFCRTVQPLLVLARPRGWRSFSARAPGSKPGFLQQFRDRWDDEAKRLKLDGVVNTWRQYGWVGISVYGSLYICSMAGFYIACRFFGASGYLEETLRSIPYVGTGIDTLMEKWSFSLDMIVAFVATEVTDSMRVPIVYLITRAIVKRRGAALPTTGDLHQRVYSATSAAYRPTGSVKKEAGSVAKDSSEISTVGKDGKKTSTAPQVKPWRPRQN
eukprot:g66001.t1